MNNSWSIQQLNPDGSAAAPAQTLAALGIESATYDLNNMAADVYTFTVGGKAIDAALIWPYGTLLALLNPNGERAFVGRVEPWTRDGKPDAQNHLGRLVNPFWFLEHLIYQQTYTVTNVTGTQSNPIYGTVTYTTPRVVLNILYNTQTGFYNATTGQQIADMVNWAIKNGAPIALGTCAPDTAPFSDFHKGITCADVLKLQFRKEPDFVMHWDYTTTPFPTVHFLKQPNLNPITINLTDTSIREQVMVRERPDWQRSYVHIFYDEKDTQPNGSVYLQIYEDWYSANGQGNAQNGIAVPGSYALPTDTESLFRGVDLFCDLQGSNVSSTTQTASFASQPYDFSTLETWQDWEPSLNDANIASITILSQQSEPPASQTYPAPTVTTLNELDANGNVVAYDPTCIYEVVDGQWADWIPNVNGQRVRVTAFAQIVTKKGEVHVRSLHRDMTVVNLNTNGISKAFTQQTTTTKAYAEGIPVGLAKSMWQSWQNLAIEGNFTNIEAVIGSDEVITRANCLNFLTANPGVNGQPDWRNVQALVQKISGDIAKGTTKVEFGAPLHLTGHELVDAVRATRYRISTIDLSYLFGGEQPGSGAGTKLGRKTHARHATHGIPDKQIDAVSAQPDPRPGIDPVITHDGTTGISTWVPPNGPTQVNAGVTTSAPQVTMDPTKAKGSDGNWHPLTIQEQKVCVNINGVLKQRTLLALTSAWYQAPSDPA